MAAQSKLSRPEDPLLLLYQHYRTLFFARLRRTTRLTRLLATLSLLATLILGSTVSVRALRKLQHERETGRRLLRRNSSLRGKDGSRTIYVPYKSGSTTRKVVIHPTKPTTFDAHRRLFLQPPRAAGLSESGAPQVPPPQTKPGLNLAFLHQFLSLLSIMVPRWHCKESGLLLSHAGFLLLRTYLSVLVARLDGAIVRDLVAGHGRGFSIGILKWLAIGSFASYTNAAIKLLQSKVSIAFRTRLTRYIHDLYLSDNLTYYKLANLDGGVGLSADQFATTDVAQFCDSAASLYSALGKPSFDLIVFNYQLFRSLGPVALSGLLANYILTATLLKRLSPPFGKLKAVEGRREGSFRALHARLIANAEEVAFYGGESMERAILDSGFRELKGWVEGIYSLKIRYNMLEDFVLKYAWSAFGYLVTALPVFLPAWGGLASSTTSPSSPSSSSSTSDSRMKDFITNKRLMLSLADAGGRLMYSLKDLSELAGSTSRVYTLLSTLHRAHASAYFHTSPPHQSPTPLYTLSDIQGTTHLGFDGLRLESVPIIAPSLWPSPGTPLIPNLTLTLRKGSHLLITGPNGVGKSAISRVLAGLWPIYRGLVSRPRSTGSDGIMFLPQRPYLSTGTLRDQVIYPSTASSLPSSLQETDAAILRILTAAHLSHLPPREGGLDTRKSWKDVLSGGEKQRMAIARVLWHEPRYAIWDEGTSAVSSDVEGLLYEEAKRRGVTVVTISTRASLKRYHEWTLTIGLPAEDGDVASPTSSSRALEIEDGEYGEEEEEIAPYTYSLQRIGTAQEKQGVEKELASLRERLSKAPEWEARRREIVRELSEDLLLGSS